MKFTIVPTHISLIKAGDTVQVGDQLRTVCPSDLKRGFMGPTLWGDSYRCGTVPVPRAVILHATPD